MNLEDDIKFQNRGFGMTCLFINRGAIQTDKQGTHNFKEVEGGVEANREHIIIGKWGEEWRQTGDT